MPFGMDIGGTRIEWQAGKQRTEIFGDTPIFFRTRRKQGTGQQFAADDGAKRNVGAWQRRVAG